MSKCIGWGGGGSWEYSQWSTDLAEKNAHSFREDGDCEHQRCHDDGDSGGRWICRMKRDGYGKRFRLTRMTE